MRLIRLSMAIILSLFSYYCASLKDSASTDLHVVINRFHHDLRWQYNEAASSQVDPRYSSAFLEELQDLKDDLHITNWEIRRVEPLPEKKQAHVRIQISYYLIPSTVIKTETVEQTWQMEGKSWFLFSQTNGPFSFPPPQDKTDSATTTTKNDDNGQADAGIDQPAP